MTIAFSDPAQRLSARYGGIAYLVIIVAGIFAEFFVRSSLLVEGDAEQTAANILANEGLFRFGFLCDLIMLICDAVVAIALYMLFVSTNSVVSLSAMVFRLVHTAVLGINLLNHFIALNVLNGTNYMSAFDNAERAALMSLAIDAHGIGYMIGLIFFAVNCAIMGYLLIAAKFSPSFLGVLIVLAAFSYLFEGLANFLFPGLASVAETVVVTVAPIAELSFCFWLLYRGFKRQPA